MSRPTDYSPEKAAEICSLLGDGQSLKEICEREDMPVRSTVYLWLSRHNEFSDMYARAREEQADTLADEIIGIADEASRDTKTLTHDDGSKYEVCDHEWINRSRLRVDARKWVAAKLKPKKYGDKVTNEHTGADGGPLVISWQPNAG